MKLPAALLRGVYPGRLKEFICVNCVTCIVLSKNIHSPLHTNQKFNKNIPHHKKIYNPNLLILTKLYLKHFLKLFKKKRVERINCVALYMLRNLC